MTSRPHSPFSLSHTHSPAQTTRLQQLNQTLFNRYAAAGSPTVEQLHATCTNSQARFTDDNGWGETIVVGPIEVPCSGATGGAYPFNKTYTSIDCTAIDLLAWSEVAVNYTLTVGTAWRRAAGHGIVVAG